MLEQATLQAGVRGIADRQWATAICPTINRTFELAQARSRTSQPSPNLDIADGNLYTLTRDSAAQTLTAIAKVDDREIAQYD